MNVRAAVRVHLSDPATRRRLLRLGWLAALVAVYVVAGKLSLRLAFVNASASPVWPPTGLALAVCLRFGVGVWPAIFVGAFLVNATTAGSWWTSLAIAAGNTLEAVCGAWLTQRFAGGPHAFSRVRRLLTFALLAGALGTMISATIGVTALALGGYATWPEFGRVWLTWWLGDLGGALLIAPLLLLWSEPLRWGRWRLRRVAEAVGLAASLLAVCWIVFSGQAWISRRSYPFDFLCIPVLMWAASRFGPRATATAACGLAATAIWGTLHGFGPFAVWSPNTSLLLLQIFMATGALSAMVLAAAVLERNHAAACLQRLHDDLEQEMDRRTKELFKSYAALQEAVQRREEAERALMEQERQYHTIIESIVDYAIFALSPEGMVRTWNQGAARITGYQTAEIIGRHFSVFYSDEDRTQGLPQALLEQARRDGRSEHTGWRLRKDGTQFWGYAVLTAMRDQAGRMVGFSKVTQDLTARRQAEEERNAAYQQLKTAHATLQKTQLRLIQAAKMESVGRLAAGVAHEVKNPLAVILMGVNYLSRSQPFRDERFPMIFEDLRQAVRRADTIVKGLLDFSAPAKLHLQPASLPDVAEQALLLLKHECDRSHITMVREFADALPPVLIDAAKIEQVFVNVCLNAIQAMGGGGTMTLRVFQQPAACAIGGGQDNGHDPRANGELPPPWVTVHVDDTGSGIPPQKLHRIFEPFFTTKPTGVGTGLGLAVSQNIIQLHGGTMTLTNRPEGGARATIMLRAAEVPAASGNTSRRGTAPDQERSRAHHRPYHAEGGEREWSR